MDKAIELTEYDGYYIIYNDGRIYSTRKNKFIRPSVNSSGYHMVFLTGNSVKRWNMVHRLVLMHFDRMPVKGEECHHKDHNKYNNHISNLEWCTHSVNILRSYRDTDRKSNREARFGYKASDNTRQLQSLAKYKPVTAIKGVNTMPFDSIQHAADYFKTYRKRIYLSLTSDTNVDGWVFHYDN